MADEPVALFVDLYLDADVDRDLANALRAEGFDVVSAWDLGRERWSDPEQLDYAISTKRAILTHNTRHYIPLAQQYWQAGREHYGIIVSEQLPPGELLRRLLRLLDRITRDEMVNTVRFLSDFADRE